MKVLNICYEDHANFSYDNSLALQSVGVECDSVKTRSHPFNYAKQSDVKTMGEIQAMIEGYDVVQVMHSSLLPFPIKKPQVVWHTGTIYRMGHASLNHVFKGVKPIIALGEFTVLCPEAEYVVGAVDTSVFKPTFTHGNTFAHYPSDPLVKGSSYITTMCAMEGVNLDYSFDKVDYSAQLERMDYCDIYIELFALIQHGKPYGSWGITALEAAAMGKVVMTCHTTKDVYERVYGESELVVSNTESEFKSNLNKWKNSPDIVGKKVATRLWVERNHSYAATGERVKKILETL